MDKRKDYSIEDKVNMVREILELAEKKGINTRLEMSVYSNYLDYNDYSEVLKFNNNYKLHEEHIKSRNIRWVILHNGFSKTDNISGNININIFKPQGGKQ
jgi:hypothetical protein